MNGWAANGDLLTRTILRLEGALSAVSLADLIRSRQRLEFLSPRNLPQPQALTSLVRASLEMS